MNQLDATTIYWSIRSAQHVSGNILPIIRSVRLRYLQHMGWETAQEGDKVASPTHRPPLPRKEIFLVLISVGGWAEAEPSASHYGLYSVGLNTIGRLWCKFYSCHLPRTIRFETVPGYSITMQVSIKFAQVVFSCRAIQFHLNYFQVFFYMSYAPLVRLVGRHKSNNIIDNTVSCNATSCNLLETYPRFRGSRLIFYHTTRHHTQ